MNVFLLKMLDLFKPIFFWQKINYVQLRTIVGVKLEMDNRRASGINMNRNATENSYAFTLSLFFFFIVSAFLGAAIYFLPAKLFAFTLFHAYLMVMVVLTLIGDFSFVLLDTSDNTIILPRPVDTKTFYAARSTHIVLYIIQIAVALSLVPGVVTFFKYGVLVGVLNVLATLLTVWLSVSLTNGLYLLLMRLFSEERLKNIINYFQIGMAVTFMGGYQILPRLINKEMVEGMGNSFPWWSILAPPMWMAGLIEWVSEFNADWLLIVLSILAVASPFAVWKISHQYLAPYFASKIADLGVSSVKKQLPGNKRDEYKPIGSFIGNDVERSGYSIVSYALNRDRKLKMRIYPSLGYMTVFAFVIFMTNKKSDVDWMSYLTSLQNTNTHLFIIYIAVFILITITFEINITDEHKASWVFYIAPVQKPGEILAGTFKAILIRMYLPIFLIASTIVLVIWKEKALLDLVFGFMASLFLLLVISNIGDKHIPQSLALNERSQGTSMARAIISMILIGITGYGHYLLTKNMLLIIAVGCLLMLLNYILYRRYRNISWEQMA